MDRSTISRPTKVNFASSFSKPVHAVFHDETVKLSHVGDAEGMSPVYLAIDSQGRSAWVPQNEVTIIDAGFLPLSQETLDVISNLGSGQQSAAGGLGQRSASSRSPQSA